MRQGGRDERSQEAAGSIVIGQSKFVDEACLGEGILRTERALMVMSSPTSGRTFCGVCRGAIKRPRHRGKASRAEGWGPAKDSECLERAWTGTAA
jgi:hypothetical protein